MKKDERTLEEVWVDLQLSMPPLAPRSHAQYYHYTTAAAKERIKQGGRLNFRLSRTDNFLDKNEGVIILEPYYHACGSLYEKDVINKAFYDLAKEIKEETLRFACPEELWLLCMTPNGHSSFMKERYAPKDGWILSFQSIAMPTWVGFSTELGIAELVEMQYSFEKMKSLIEASLKDIYLGYRHDQVSGRANVDRIAKEVLIGMLRYYGHCFKSANYKDEEEVRLIVRKLKQGFTQWDSEDGQISLQMRKENDKDQLYLVLGEDFFYAEKQSMGEIDNKKYNKFVLSPDDLKNI